MKALTYTQYSEKNTHVQEVVCVCGQGQLAGSRFSTSSMYWEYVFLSNLHHSFKVDIIPIW